MPEGHPLHRFQPEGAGGFDPDTVEVIGVDLKQFYQVELLQRGRVYRLPYGLRFRKKEKRDTY